MIQFFCGLGDAAGLDFSWRLPIWFDAGFSTRPFQKMPGRQFLDPLDYGVRRRNIVQTQKTVEAVHIEFPIDGWVRQNGFDFGSEYDVIRSATEVKRLDS